MPRLQSILIACLTLTSSVQAFAQPGAPVPASSAPAPAAPAAPAAPPAGAPAPPAAPAGEKPVDPNAKAEAQAKFEKGLKLFEDGAFQLALLEFQASREKFPTRAATRNAALVLRKLERFDEAIEMWETLEREFPNLPPAELAQSVQEKKELAALVGFLSFDVNEADAAIFLDGREIGKSPLTTSIRVAGGRHQIRIYKEAFAPFEKPVDVASGAVVKVAAKLSPLQRGGRLRVAEQGGAKVKVLVDGVQMGLTPWEGLVAEGKHTVTLQGEGDVGSAPTPVNVPLNQATNLTILAEPLPCTLKVQPTPANARVAINGVEVGVGAWEGRLRCGGHAVELAADGFLPVTKGVSLTKGAPGVVVESLERDPNSELWKAKNPPRITLEGRMGFLIGPSIGGDIVGLCGEGCAKSASVGTVASFNVGYQLGIGLGFAADIGFLYEGQSVEGRKAKVEPVGLPAQEGRAADSIKLYGLTLGAALTYERGEKVVWGGRLGTGIALSGFSDSRYGTFSYTNDQGQPASYNTPRIRDRHAFGDWASLYLAPEFRLGYRFGKLVLLGGLQAFVKVGLSAGTWSLQQEVPAAGARCGANVSPSVRPDCQGQGTYGSETVLGGISVALSPTVAARYEF
ncbi:MAG: PEGA domain-containing protein [Polyangiaceae bacterium]